MTVRSIVDEYTFNANINKNLIVCGDGTWNSQDQSEGGLPAPTNVWKFYKALLDEDTSGGKQILYSIRIHFIDEPKHFRS